MDMLSYVLSAGLVLKILRGVFPPLPRQYSSDLGSIPSIASYSIV